MRDLIRKLFKFRNIEINKYLDIYLFARRAEIGLIYDFSEGDYIIGIELLFISIEITIPRKDE